MPRFRILNFKTSLNFDKFAALKFRSVSENQFSTPIDWKTTHFHYDSTKENFIWNVYCKSKASLKVK